MNRTPLALGSRLVGQGQPCLVAAHVGHAHDGRVEDALQLIEAAFQAGADAIVFSLFRADELLVRRHPERRELEAVELAERDWRRVLEAARGSGLAVVAEALDRPSLELALSAGVDAVQSHAGDADHPELLRALATAGRPLLLAAGCAGLPQLRDAVSAATAGVAVSARPDRGAGARRGAAARGDPGAARAAARERGPARPDRRRLRLRARRPGRRRCARRRARREAAGPRPQPQGEGRRGRARPGGALPLGRAAAAGRARARRGPAARHGRAPRGVARSSRPD